MIDLRNFYLVKIIKMPAQITRKCQDAFDYVQRKLENFNYGIRTFGNTEVEVYSNGDWRICLWNTNIIRYYKDENRYEVKNWGRRTRTTSHDIRAYLRLFLDYDFQNWEIIDDNHQKIPCEDRRQGYGSSRFWSFNPTNRILWGE